LERIEKHLVIDDMNTIEIAIALNKDRVPTASGEGQWWDHSISSLIINDGFFGDFDANKYFREINKETGKKKLKKRPKKEWKVVTNPCPIFTKERVMKMRGVLARHKVSWKKKPVKGHEEDHLFIEVLHCGLCKCKVSKGRQSRRNVKTGKKTPLYTCQWSRGGVAKREQAGRQKCDILSVNSDKVDQYVMDYILRVITDTDPKTIDALLDSTGSAERERRLQERLAQLDKQEKSFNNKIEKILDAIEGETISHARAKDRMARNETGLKDIANERKSIKRELADIKRLSNDIVRYKKEWMRLLQNRGDLSDKILSLPFKKKKILIREIFENGFLEMSPITLADAEKQIEDHEWSDGDGMFGTSGVFFSEKSPQEGVEIEIDLNLKLYEIHKMLKLLLYSDIHKNINDEYDQ